ncbi:RICIN domain-containing protein [Inquilinus sp. OTU3971]|uniref:RICIN domain-containing protein n=1 Tax=Inquilinus sp. OTU3971 TaxID=3043855 RepID=UPI00313C3B0E
MPQLFFLKATYSAAKYSSAGPMVVELGGAISPAIPDWPTSYQLQLAAQQLPTLQAPIPNANQLWFLSETDGGTMICSAANPALAIGYNFGQRYDLSFQAIACTPVTAYQNQWIWKIASGSPAGHTTSITFNNTAGPPFDYYLNVNYNTMAAGTIIILYPYTGAVNTGAYFILEPYVPQWVSLQTNAPDAKNVSGNFVIGFSDGIVEAQAQPTTQVFRPGTLSQLWAFNPDGSIRNAADLSLAITAPASVNNSITMQTVTGAPAASQIWSLTGNMALANTATGDCLNVWGGPAPPPTGV